MWRLCCRFFLIVIFDYPDPKDSLGKGCLSEGILWIGMIVINRQIRRPRPHCIRYEGRLADSYLCKEVMERLIS
jgi:hypothetical protein